MERLRQQVQQAYQELSALAEGSTSADIMLAKVTAYELSNLREHIDDTIRKGDQQELERCLGKCHQLQGKIQAVRKMVEQDAQRETERASTPSVILT